MSRCFPYPPPGYALSIERKEALIESIKFQKEKLKAEELKKEKKREKKEKRKDKKEKSKKTLNQGNSDITHGRPIGEHFWADPKKADPLQKGSKADSEQLERSNLTEEHNKPICLRVPSSSSESSENSHKRKRLPSPADVSRGHGKIIRIRLSSKNASSLDEQKQCSTSGRADFPLQTNIGFCSTSGSRTIQLPPQTNNDICSTSRPTTYASRSLVLKTNGERIHVASKQVEPAPVTTKMQKEGAFKKIEAAPIMTKVQKEGLLYENLIANWAPPQLQDVGLDNGDMDWLFTSKNKVERSEMRSKCRDDSLSHGSTPSWPRAHYLPEVEVYALPYTVPF